MKSALRNIVAIAGIAIGVSYVMCLAVSQLPK